MMPAVEHFVTSRKAAAPAALASTSLSAVLPVSACCYYSKYSKISVFSEAAVFKHNA
jgi:hypothetical protein